MSTLRVTSGGFYAVVEGQLLRVSSAGGYAVVQGQLLRVSAVGAYAAIAGIQLRATSVGAYAVIAPMQLRATSVGAYAVVQPKGGRVSTVGMYAVAPRPMPCGDPPQLSVYDITATTASAYVEPTEGYLNSDYDSIEYELYQGGVRVDTYQDFGPLGTSPYAPFSSWDMTGLTDGVEYEIRARGQLDCGPSRWTEPIVFTARDSTLGSAWDPGCPPGPLGYVVNPDANPITPETRFGKGFFRPLPGEPLVGTARVIFRWDETGNTYDFAISDDLGETWTTVATGVTSTSASINPDGDGLVPYEFDLDTSAYTPGVGDYRLKAINTDTLDEVVSLAFAIDIGDAFDDGFDSGFEKGGTVDWWTHRGAPALNGKFGRVLNTTYDVDHPYFSDLWMRARDGSLLAPTGHPFSGYANLDAGSSLGGDVTLRLQAWSGEGGRIVQTGVWDLEGWWAGIGFQLNGTGDESSGIAVLLHNFAASALGCCDGFLTGDGMGDLQLWARPEGGFWGIVGSVVGGGGGVFTDGGTGSDLTDGKFEKFYGKAAYHAPWLSLTIQERNAFPSRSYRDGNNRGANVVTRRSCGRRYEIYCIRAKLDIDPASANEVRVRARLDGPGVVEPDSGYWHCDRTVVFDTEWACGYAGIVSSSVDILHNDGCRMFYTMSVIPGSSCVIEEEIPEDEEPVEIPEIGPIPCPPEEITASHALWLGTANNNDLLQYGASELDNDETIYAVVEPLPLAAEGFGGEFMVLNTYIAFEHVGDVYMEVTPIANGKRLTDETKEFLVTGNGVTRQVNRVELPWTQPYPLSGTERARRGVRCQHFTVRIVLTDYCGSGLSLAGLEHEIEPVRERLGHSSEFTEWALDASPWIPGTRLMLGARASKAIHGWTQDSLDDSGTDFGWTIKPEWVAPAGVGGEAIFTNVYLVISRQNATEKTITVTPHLDNVAQQVRTVTLPAVTEFTTEVHEVAIQQPYPSRVGERQRFAPRGCWFTVEITGAREDQETIVIEGIEVEFEPVRETQEPVTNG